MFRRFFMVLRSWFSASLCKREDPERLLMGAASGCWPVSTDENWKRAVQAITQKNNLKRMIEETEKRIQELERDAEVAEERNEVERAVEIRRNMLSYEQTLVAPRQQLEQAIAMSERLKEAIKREEMKMHEQTVEALEQKAALQKSEIQTAIHKALMGLENLDK